jgi:HK97 family phage major capsid protein/HK97 family phage prohead protease
MQDANLLPQAIREAQAAKPLSRALQFERAQIDEEARTATLAFASEAPFDRWWGREILDVSPTAMRLQRLTSGANLLVDHDTRDVVGVVEQVEVGAERVARAVVRFGRSVRAEEVWQDVKDGIRRNVSVGYMIHAAKLIETDDDDDDTYRVTDWEPYEVSLVSVPADPSVGVGRALAQPQAAPHAPPAPFSAPAAADPATPVAGPSPAADRAAPAAPTPQPQPLKGRTMSDVQVTERNHAAEISQLAATIQGYDARELALKSIQAGHTVEQFQAEVLRQVANKPLAADVKLNERERKQYSYVRAIAAAIARAEGQAVSGFEAELSQELERQLPANAKRHGGIFVPMRLQAERAAIAESLWNTSTKGSSTVFTEPGEFIDLLRNQAVAVELGARVMAGLTSPVSFPKQTGAATAYWMPENDGTNVTASNATLGSVSLTPKTLQATTAFSRQLMAQSSIDVEQFVRNDLAAQHALAWDRAVLHGSGSNNEPTGIYAAGSVNSIAMGGTPTYGKLIDMVTEVLKDNALMGSLAFATTPGMAGKLAQTVIAASTDSRMIWTGPLNDGQLVGYRAVATNQVLATLGSGSDHGVIFGDFTSVMIGTWGALEIVVDPYALKKQGMVEVTSFQLADIALRHPQSFCKATGATI